MANLTVVKLNQDDPEAEPEPIITFIDVPPEWAASILAVHDETIEFVVH